jgi:P4 family phage/plasmid primase-like protien
MSDDVLRALADAQAAHEEELLPPPDLQEERRTAAREMSTRTMEMFEFTERGDALRFAAHFVDVIRCDATGQRAAFYILNTEGRWRLDVSGEIFNAANVVIDAMIARANELSARPTEDDDDPGAALRNHARQLSTEGSMRRMVTLGCALGGMMVEADKTFDLRRELISAGPWTLELTPTGIANNRAREIAPEDLITFSAGCAFDFSAALRPPPPSVVDFLNNFIPEPEKRDLIFKVLGSSLIGSNPHRLFVIIKGPTTTGKSQFTEAVEAALGDYAATLNSSIFRGSLDDKPRPDLLQAMKKRLVFMSEASKNWHLHGDRVKDLTGGGKIAARNMHGRSYLSEVPQFLPVLVTNEMPTIDGVDLATRRRMMVIPFEHQLTASRIAEDGAIKQEFIHDPEVHRWLLAMLVRGYVLACRDGLEDALTAFQMDTDAAFAEMSSVADFLNYLHENEELLILPDESPVSHAILLKEFHLEYVDWLKNHGTAEQYRGRLSGHAFNAKLRDDYKWDSKQSAGLRWVGKTTKRAVTAREWSP